MPKPFRLISVVGLGYIGLPTAATIAARQIHVIGVDVNEQTVATINQGRIHIIEPELDMLVRTTVQDGFLRAVTSPEPADVFLIAVPTPFKKNHMPDLHYVRMAVTSIAPVLKKGDLVILESTSPIGTTEQIAAWLAGLRPDLVLPQQNSDMPDIHIAYCPERVLPGRIVHELIENDRIIGGMTPECSRRASEFYRIFVAGQLLVTNARTAEMTKLAENSFRDVNIAFANELSMLAHRFGINVWEMIRLANHHPRVNILRPGAGVGGHCIAVDPWFLVHGAPDEARIIRTAREVNDSKPGWVLMRVAEAVAMSGANHPLIAVLGLTFKPDIDDLRESPAMHIAECLAQTHPGKLRIVEPNIMQLPPTLANETLCSLDEALDQAQLVVLLVAHQSFKELRVSSQQQVIDAVGMT